MELILLFGVLSLAASFVNGSIGYGYSSLSVPLALLVFASRVINPAYALVEAFANTVMLAASGKKGNAATIRRNLPVIISAAPGAILGSLVVSRAAPSTIKIAAYVVILPLVLLQAAGFRRPVKNEKAAGVPLGFAVGSLYGVTTISGPPIALFYNNQGLGQAEFKASIAQVRVVESYFTCASYYFLGLFGPTSLSLFSVIAPPVVLGLPMGLLIARRASIEVFRRVCMGFDALVVGYGLSQAVIVNSLLTPLEAYAMLAAVAAAVALLLLRFFRGRRLPGEAVPLTGVDKV